MVLSGCSKTNTEESSSEITYSNLADQSTRDEIQEIMMDAGISKTLAANFMSQVEEFNSIINNTGLVEKGFIPMTDIPVYDELTIQELWEKKYTVFVGLNCRITSFELMKDFISIQDKDNPDTGVIFMDLLSLENVPSPILNQQEKNTFSALYSVIQTVPSSDIATQYSTIVSEWNRRKITISANDKVSLISVYLDSAITDEEHELFIGHTGVLFPTQDGRYLFVEKLAFQMPYQATYFPDKEALYDYLMKMYDLPLGENTSRPIIMENDKWLANTIK